MKMNESVSNRSQMIAWLNANKINFKKIIFKNASPFMKNRYKDEFVTWEAWIYGTSAYGVVVTGNDEQDYAVTNLTMAL